MHDYRRVLSGRTDRMVTRAMGYGSGALLVTMSCSLPERDWGKFKI